MAKFTIWQGESPYAPPKYIIPEDVDKCFDNLGDVWWKASEIRENIRNLIAKNNILPQCLDLDNMLQLKDLCDNKKYREFLKRRNYFLENHQVMDANEFAKLFWNDNLKNDDLRNQMVETLKKIHSKYNDGEELNMDRELISGKYNKSDIKQWKLWICTFDTFLKQLKETPFFETLIRCSLQRNETNDWWKCLIPFCNNEWRYEEISDADIDYLKNSEYEGKKLLSDSSLWFNILETLLVKMVWNKNKYPNLWIGYWKFRHQNKIISYNNLQTLTPEELHGNTRWISNNDAYNYFLWPNTIKQGYAVENFNDNEVEWLINLTKTWIIKLRTWVMDNKINSYIKNNSIELWNNTPVNNDLHEDSNEKILNERWYTLKIFHEAWPNEEVSMWKAENLWTTIKIKWTKERFVPGHAYSIEGMHKKDGETFVTIINPRYTWKKIDVPLKYIKEFFYVWVDWFNLDKMFVESQEHQEK